MYIYTAQIIELKERLCHLLMCVATVMPLRTSWTAKDVLCNHVSSHISSLVLLIVYRFSYTIFHTCISLEDCSKECQKAHWPRHKLFCNAKFEERKRGKNVVKGEEPKEVTITHLGPVVNIGEGPILPQGVPLGLPIVRKAIYELMSHRIENVQYGEKAYMNVYNDVVQNEEGWLEVR